MLQLILFVLLLMNSVIFFLMNNPLSMGLILMIQTFLISLFSGCFTLMFWFSYSLFLIFLGGMLILFMYMTSLASNETFKFKLNIKKTMLISTFTFCFFLIFWFMDFKNFLFSNKIFNNENNSFFMMKIMKEQNYFLLNKMYNFPTNMITILLVNYLFLTLIASVKITNIYSGPLRSKI